MFVSAKCHLDGKVVIVQHGNRSCPSICGLVFDGIVSTVWETNNTCSYCSF